MADNSTQASATASAATDSAAAAARNTTDAMRDAGERMRDTFQSGMAEPAKRATEAMRATGEKMAQGGSTLGLKMLDQAEQNAQAGFAAMRQAAQAKDVSDVMKIQSDFMREYSSRSMAQAREIGELIVQFGRDAVAPLRGQ